MGISWIDKAETTIDTDTERAELERRVKQLERQVQDLTEWLTELCDDTTIENTERMICTA